MRLPDLQRKRAPGRGLRPAATSLRKGNRIRRVAVVTGTRAEFGLLEPLLEAMRNGPCDARLIVTGMHLLAKFGRTSSEIRRTGWPIAAQIRMQNGDDNAAAEGAAVGRGIRGIAEALNRMQADAVVVLGDRIEAFAGACAAATSRRVLIHIHGGDRAVGDVDDALRNAITRLAHVHFVASGDAERRLLRMGEERFRIHRVGAPGLDDIRRFRALDRARPAETAAWFRHTLGPIAGRPYAVVVYHASGRRPQLEAATMRRIAACVQRCGLAGVAIYPNSDPGHEGILGVLSRLERRQDWRVLKSLPRREYLRLVSRSAVLVGNSSSGIIESAALGVNAVNVGHRQAGRLRCGPGVIDVEETSDAILRGLREALHRRHPRPGRSVYGDGTAGLRMARLLATLRITPRLLQKRLSY